MENQAFFQGFFKNFRKNSTIFLDLEAENTLFELLKLVNSSVLFNFKLVADLPEAEQATIDRFKDIILVCLNAKAHVGFQDPQFFGGEGQTVANNIIDVFTEQEYICNRASSELIYELILPIIALLFCAFCFHICSEHKKSAANHRQDSIDEAFLSTGFNRSESAVQHNR